MLKQLHLKLEHKCKQEPAGRQTHHNPRNKQWTSAVQVFFFFFIIVASILLDEEKLNSEDSEKKMMKRELYLDPGEVLHGCKCNSDGRIHMSSGDVTHCLNHYHDHKAKCQRHSHMGHFTMALGISHGSPTSWEHQNEGANHLSSKLKKKNKSISKKLEEDQTKPLANKQTH